MSNKYIIHFTDSYAKIESILSAYSLKLKYCQEIFNLGNERISSAAHPMVCFSEYGVDELKSRAVTYGQYGIAFLDSWIQKNKIHPVLYIDKDSIAATALAQLLRARQNKQTSKLPDSLRLPIMTIKCFTKNTVGYNSYYEIDEFNFRDEHEWRFVPTKKTINGNLISQNKSTYSKAKDKYNEKLLPFPLKFTIEDVEKIFVTSDEERSTLAGKLSIDVSKIVISCWKYNKLNRANVKKV